MFSDRIGDIDQAALDRLDLVFGCFHSALRRKEDQTERYLAALRNPSIRILGHPRGRIYNFRLGLSADWTRVFALAAKLDKAVEIDCYPDRQDLNVDLLAITRKEGCRISMGTDSHGPSQLEFMDLGIAAAIRAKLDLKKILNYMPTDQLLGWAERFVIVDWSPERGHAMGPISLPRQSCRPSLCEVGASNSRSSWTCGSSEDPRNVARMTISAKIRIA